jgi:hypothetical protein
MGKKLNIFTARLTGLGLERDPINRGEHRRGIGNGSREVGEGEPKPMPLGDKCNYLCPYFRCTKKALMITMKYIKGSPSKVGYCRWVGDLCITGDCQYAYCEKRALLPGNKCAFAIRKEEKKTVKSEEEDISLILDDKVKNLLKKHGHRDLDVV